MWFSFCINVPINISIESNINFKPLTNGILYYDLFLANVIYYYSLILVLIKLVFIKFIIISNNENPISLLTHNFQDFLKYAIFLEHSQMILPFLNDLTNFLFAPLSFFFITFAFAF